MVPSIDLTLCTSLYLDFSRKVDHDPCGSDHFPIVLENGGLERVQSWKLTKSNLEQFQHLCSTRLHQSTIMDADDHVFIHFHLEGHCRENYS